MFLAVVTEKADALETLKPSLHTGNPITMVETGLEKEFFYRVSNPAVAETARFQLHLGLTN